MEENHRWQPLIDGYVRQFGLDQHLNPDLLRSLRLASVLKDFELCSQTREQQYLWLLVKGKVQVTYYHQNGKYSVLALMSPLALIGDVELFSGSEIMTTVLTVEPSVLLWIDKEFALKYGDHDPKFLHFVMQQLTLKLIGTSLVMTRQGLPLISQVAAYLLAQPVTSDHYLMLESIEHLANLLGTTSRHLNRVLRQLTDEGLITRRRRVMQILNRPGLQQYAEP